MKTSNSDFDEAGRFACGRRPQRQASFAARATAVLFFPLRSKRSFNIFSSAANCAA
jgi:hypothetical protein